MTGYSCHIPQRKLRVFCDTLPQASWRICLARSTQFHSLLSPRMPPSRSSSPRYLPRLVQRIAVVALAAGVGVWGAILLAPSPPPAPPTAAASTSLATDTQPVSRWFGTGSGAKIQVVVAGLISAGPRGSAVLGIDGRPARAYAVGNDLAEGVTLAEVGRNGVVLNQGGERVEVLASTLPALGDTIRILPASR